MCGMFTEIFGMSVALYLTDMILRPNLSFGATEVVIFFVQGALAFLVYHYLKTYMNNQNGSYNAPVLNGMDMILGAAMGGTVLYLTDMFLGITLYQSIGVEIVKFLIQGSILWFTFSSFSYMFTAV